MTSSAATILATVRIRRERVSLAVGMALLAKVGLALVTGGAGFFTSGSIRSRLESASFSGADALTSAIALATVLALVAETEVSAQRLRHWLLVAAFAFACVLLVLTMFSAVDFLGLHTAARSIEWIDRLALVLDRVAAAVPAAAACVIAARFGLNGSRGSATSPRG